MMRSKHEIEIDQIHDRQLAEKDEEIERLRRDHQIVRNFLDAADAKLLKQEKLITELCDVMSWYVEPETDNGLIERAREAIR